MRTVRFQVDKQAELQPDKVFMIAPEFKMELTYAQLKESSLRLGKHLLKMGLKKGDKISFFMGNGYQTMIIFLGTMYAGLVVSPINLMAQPSQLRYVLEHSDTKLVFSTELNRERLQEALQGVSRDVKVMIIDKYAQEIFPTKIFPPMRCPRSAKTIRPCCSIPRAPPASPRELF